MFAISKTAKKGLALVVAFVLFASSFLGIISSNVFADSTEETPYEEPIIGEESYDFSNASEYSFKNDGDSKYYSCLGNTKLSDGISVGNGALKLNSGSNSGRTVQTWVINKNGKPFELVPGVEYKVTFNVKQTKIPSANSTTYISLSNGVCLADSAWSDNLGASASVMSEGDNDKYEYSKGNKQNANLTTYPNNAINASYSTNHICYIKNGRYLASAEGDDIETTFVAYDITNNGINKENRNYLALTFALYKGQEIEIDNIKIMYDYSKYTKVTFVDGEEENATILKVDEKVADLNNKGDYTFIGWYDDNGEKVTVVPKIAETGKITLTAKWDNPFEQPITLSEENNYSVTYDFDASNGDAYLVSSAYTGYKAYKNIDTSNGVLHVSANDNEASSQLWTVNKNGKPFLLKNGITYNISFELSFTGSVAPEVLLAGGIENGNSAWNGCAPEKTTSVKISSDKQLYSASFTAADVTNNGSKENKRNYLAFIFNLEAGQNVEVKSISITYDFSKHTLVTYQYDPNDTADTETVFSNVGDETKSIDYVNDRKFVAWKNNGSDVKKIPSVATGRILLVAELETDPLEGLNKYDFSKSHQYEIDNANGKFISTYYGGISSAIQREVESGIEVSDGKLKLTSGLQNSADYSASRTVKTWVINKNGVPFEFTPGETYSVSFTVKQNGSPTVLLSYIALANGVNLNDNSWADNLGTSASVMKDAKDNLYTYKSGANWQWPSAKESESYPNNVVSANSQNKLVCSSTPEGIKEQEVSITFTAYDIASQGDNYKNYLALVYSLSGEQEIEIDNLTIHESEKNTIVTYDYRDGTSNTEYLKIGDKITAPDMQNIPNGKKQEGWRDASGNIYTTVPKGVNGKITLYPNLVRKNGNNNVENPLKKTLDFEFADEYETQNADDTLIASIYKGGISSANQKVIHNDITVEDGILRIGSGIPNDIDVGTVHNVQTWIINDNGKPIELKPGTSYTVNFKVRQNSAPKYITSSYISLSNGVSYSDNSWNNNLGASASVMPENKDITYVYKNGAGWRWPSDGLTGYPNNAIKASNDNKLIYDNTLAGFVNGSVSYTFTAYDITDGGKKSNCKNYLALTVALRQGQEIEIDDFIIYETDSYKLVSYNLGGNGEMDSFFAQNGDVIKLTDLQDTQDAMFAGWYLDSKYSVPVENNIYTIGKNDKSIVFYAKFVKFTILEDFENYAAKTFRFEGEINRNPQLGYYSFITDKFAKDGKYSLHLNALGDETNRTWVKLTDNGNDFKVSEGQTYLFTIDYYVENAESDIEFFPYISGSEGIWQTITVNGKTDGVYREQRDYTMTIPRLDKGKGWKRIAFEFTPTLQYSDYNSLYFRFINLTKGTSIYMDNFKAELVTDKNTLATIYPGNGENPMTYMGLPGQKIDMPTVTSKYMNFLGWYTDVKFAKPYTGDFLFESKSISLYAKWQYKKGIEINEGFENYKGNLPSSNFSIVSEDPASGDKCLKYVFDLKKDQYDYLSLYIDDDIASISNGQRFAMSFKYKILEDLPKSTNLAMGFSTANHTQLKIEQYDNFLLWAYRYIPGEWHIFNDILTAEKLKSGDNILKFEIGTLGEFANTVYIDDIKLIPLQEDDVVLTLYTDQLSTNLPTHIIGKAGDEFVYPTKATRTVGKWFLGGWTTDRWLKDLVPQDTGVFLAGEDLKVWARWCKENIYEGFEKDFAELSGEPGLKNIGQDYEIYNGQIKGFNKSNVKTGSSSLHRIGKSHMWKNTQVLIGDNTLAVGRKYELSFNVKMDKSLHTDGSIRIIACGVKQTAYDVLGEYLNVINISDLTDNVWHKVTFNFVALSEYLSISTPGYCSLYIDDLTIKLLPDDSKISDSIYCANEYQPLLRDKDGNIIKTGISKLNLKDDSLKVNIGQETPDNHNTIIVISMVGGTVLLAASILLGIVIVKKNKKNKMRI